MDKLKKKIKIHGHVARHRKSKVV